ncbi:forkhead box protein N1 isoform X1 [Etheostoma spectabile]|uniref:forkhead box protein N1 isoform X1 n=1 Tax=Etheostoma spectabile TaxID=54343 RepID=UPI0013AF8D88|nr:forkhead box protein N4-like isoform X1 [Etheostoma spectabile]XP_032368193.1 forkhead box protein N4-like isoform X1 [Etheostoma spectabile]
MPSPSCCVCWWPCSPNGPATTNFLLILACEATTIKIHPLSHIPAVSLPRWLSCCLQPLCPTPSPSPTLTLKLWTRSRFWRRMSDSPTFSHTRAKSQTSTHQASLHTCESGGTSCQQMAESQKESNTFSLRTAVLNRRHSADGTIGSGSAPGQGPIDSDRFHPYRRQFSDGAVTAAGCLQQCSSSFSCLQEVCSSDTLLHKSSSEAPSSWDQYNDSVQSSYPKLTTLPAEPSCFLSQSYPSYSSSSPLQQVSSRLYPNNDKSSRSKYCLQSLSSQSYQESTTQSHFPKPIYSYSILIFLALKNSKTGSLPVSEIYSFMTEHFPYFKSAPDGWKNSVRHNLSLNKCFEKVENKNGNSSRKGCLWALNPAKVEKMQEELNKWRRKDPVTVRRSMAKPEDLDQLLGERPDKFRSVPLYTNPALLSRVAPIYGPTSSSCAPAQLRPPYLPVQRPQYAQVQPQQPRFLPSPTAHPSNSFVLYSPCGQLPAAGVPSATGSLHSPMTGKMPPVYSAALQAEFSSRNMQDLLLEGDASYDIDTLNPSLTDLQLQGNLWEELQEDSLLSDPQFTTTTPSSTSALRDHSIQTSCLQATPPVGQTSEGTAFGRRKAEYEDENTGRYFEQHGCLNGLHPVAYSGMESLAGYLTSCTTSITLM